MTGATERRHHDHIALSSPGSANRARDEEQGVPSKERARTYYSLFTSEVKLWWQLLGIIIGASIVLVRAKLCAE